MPSTAIVVDQSEKGGAQGTPLFGRNSKGTLFLGRLLVLSVRSFACFLRALGICFWGRLVARVKVDPGDKSHRRGVARAWTKFDNAGVAAVARSTARSDFGEEFAHCFNRAGAVVVKQRKRTSARMQTFALCQGDHLFSQRPDRLGFRERSGDPSILDETAGLVGQHGIAMLSSPAKFNCFATMAHDGLT